MSRCISSFGVFFVTILMPKLMPGLSMMLYTRTRAASLSTVIQAAGTSRSTTMPLAQYTKVIHQLSFPDKRLYGPPGTLTNSGICFLVSCRYSGKQKRKINHLQSPAQLQKIYSDQESRSQISYFPHGFTWNIITLS